ncbi:MAG: hypothetical protein IJR53_07990 [Bacteroidales bacterium]|nr:hypothetical protein [Bacteroidales bacterium]
MCAVGGDVKQVPEQGRRNRRSNQSRRSLPESTVKASGFKTRLCGCDRGRTAPQKRTAKIQKSTVRERLRKRWHGAGAPAGKRE